MKLIAQLAKHSIVAAAAIIFILPASTWGQGSPRSQPDSPAGRQLNMLVLGDSILWGQGLKNEHKAWFQVKDWLRNSAGRDVSERIQAHSGAVVGSSGDPQTNSILPADGEVNSALPTVNEQLDEAIRFYRDSSQVDLVLVDGCINDVSVFNLLNAGNTTAEIAQLTASKCGPSMQALLGRVANAFPSAHIIVAGYFPIISAKTPDSLLMRAVARMFYRSSPLAPSMKSKQLRGSLIAVSRAWYQDSNRALAEAVRQTSDALSAKGSRQQVLFVEIPFPPEYSFETKETRLWGFNASFLRKLLAILTLGKVSLRTNDEQRRSRLASCNEFFKRPAGESKKEKQTRELRLMLCNYASIGHPNQRGEQIYSEAIINRIKSLIANPGWLRDARPAAAPSPSR